jgi:hypothetical protein
MASNSLTLDQLRNVAFPENSPERAQQKAQEDQAIGAFVEAMKKFDYANANAQDRESELEAAKVTERTGVSVHYESSFWNQGALVFPKQMLESSVRATLVKITTTGEAPPIEGNPEEGYTVAMSDLASAAPDLAQEAKTEQQQEVRVLKAAQTNAANNTLAAHGWDLHGYNHRWLKYTPPADSLPQTAAATPAAAPAAAVHPLAAEIQAATRYALARRPATLAKPASIGVEKPVVARPLPANTPHLSHHAQLTAQNAKTLAEMRELAEKTRLAAQESASASQAVIQSLGGLG